MALTVPRACHPRLTPELEGNPREFLLLGCPIPSWRDCWAWIGRVCGPLSCPAAGTWLLLGVGTAFPGQAGQIPLLLPLSPPLQVSAKGHPGPGVFGHEIGASPGSQHWGDPRSHPFLHAQDEESDSKVT